MQKRALFTTKQLTLLAILIAMAVLLKSFLSIETGTFRFTFYEIPMIIIGVLFGQTFKAFTKGKDDKELYWLSFGFVLIITALSGTIVDFFHMMFSPWAFTFNLFTISNIVWATIPGVIFFFGRYNKLSLIVAIVLSAILAFTLNTLGIIQFQGMGAMLGTLPYRLIVLAIKIPLLVVVIDTLYHRVIVSELKLIRQA